MMRLAAAIPDSALGDETTKLAKTRKISQMARSMAIFGVRTILVYRDGDNPSDRSLLVTVLRYLETPQFMRKRMFPRMSALKFAGALQPLAIPSHSLQEGGEVQPGDVREGLAVALRGRRYVDVGVGKLFELRGAAGRTGRVTVRFPAGGAPDAASVVSPDEMTEYWGYAVRERPSINSVLREWQGQIIVASRTGKPATAARLGRRCRGDVLAVFGSPQRDVQSIAGGRLSGANLVRLNFFPGQNTRTVRLEEAILGTLSILNMHEAGNAS